MMKALITTAVLLCGIRFAQAEEIGTVNTAFKLLGSDKIVVEVFDDPQITGVSCYVSRAKTGGLTGAIGLAEDKADSSVACRQVGDITFKETVPKQRDVFTERASFFLARACGAHGGSEAACPDLPRLQRQAHRRQPKKQRHRRSARFGCEDAGHGVRPARRTVPLDTSTSYGLSAGLTPGLSHRLSQRPSSAHRRGSSYRLIACHSASKPTPTLALTTILFCLSSYTSIT